MSRARYFESVFLVASATGLCMFDLCSAQEEPPVVDRLEEDGKQFRQIVQELLPVVEKIAAERLPQAAQGSPSRINLFKVGRCLTRRSQHGGLAYDRERGGLVGICLVDGDLNVPSSETVFAVSIGAWRLSQQPHPISGTQATIESIVILDGEEP